MSPLLPGLLLAVGLACLLAGLALLRWLGPRLRVARLLAATPNVSIDEAIAAARAGDPRYVLVQGRVSSDEEFPDELDRPLVYRRRHLEVRPNGTGRSAWRTVEDEREAVPFGIEQRGSYIGVDAARLDEGLVVLSRESEGLASEIPGRLPPDTDPAAVVRLRVLQISAVEHVGVAGQPVLAADGSPTMTAGQGRPLILTALERGEAMRVIGEGRRSRLGIASALLALGVLLVAVALAVGLVGVLGVADVRAASPAPLPTPSATAPGGDTRSSGQGPGLVGEPFVALAGVLVVGLVTVGATLVLVRVSRRE